MTRAELEYF